MSHSAIDNQVPVFYCPITPKVHPDRAMLDNCAIEWMFNQEMDRDEEQRRRLSECDFGGLTAMTMPDGLTDSLTVMAKLHAVLFSFDDGVCDEVNVDPGALAGETSRIMRVLEAPTPNWDDDGPHAAALREIRLMLDTHATPTQVRRWINGMRIYTSSLVWEAVMRRSGVVPSVNDYVTMWMRAIGMSPATALIDAVAGYEVPDEAFNRPQVQALTEMTWVLVSWDNDLYSRRKEIERVGDRLNLVDVLAHERGIDADEALGQVVSMRDRVMVLFMHLYDQEKREAGPELARYLDGLALFVRGHLDWAFGCGRYAESSRSGADASLRWSAHPSDDALTPLPIPSISWWWDHVATAGGLAAASPS